MKPRLGRPPKYTTPPRRLNITLPHSLYDMLQKHVESGDVRESMSDFVQRAIAFLLTATKGHAHK